VLLILQSLFTTAIEERENCYSFILYRTPHETIRSTHYFYLEGSGGIPDISPRNWAHFSKIIKLGLTKGLGTEGGKRVNLYLIKLLLAKRLFHHVRNIKNKTKFVSNYLSIKLMFLKNNCLIVSID
jgi:hypothetical protein